MTKLLKFGFVGTVIAALCCFTPVLVVIFGVLGLSALTGYLDFVLLPVLVFFIILTGVALYRRSNSNRN
jgi:mercuric ion transport protein